MTFKKCCRQKQEHCMRERHVSVTLINFFQERNHHHHHHHVLWSTRWRVWMLVFMQSCSKSKVCGKLLCFMYKPINIIMVFTFQFLLSQRHESQYRTKIIVPGSIYIWKLVYFVIYNNFENMSLCLSWTRHCVSRI